jgi:glycosidase
VTWDEVSASYVRRWEGELPAQPRGTMVRYTLAAQVSGSDQWVCADNQAASLKDADEFALWFDGQGAPGWSREAQVYHVFLDRFYPGDGKSWLKPADLGGFFGGTLAGVLQKLDYIQSLGFNTLWLSPLFISPSHHGYDATDYYTVEPRLGTNADLEALIAEAHRRGMRVLLDFVANHWSEHHPIFRQALSDEHSPYHDWFTWNHWPDEYFCYFNVRSLPKLNLKYAPARQYLLDCAAYWLKKGVDGFRLDYANGPTHDFWTDFRRTCRTTKPDSWIFGEIVHTAPMQASFAGRLDGALDFLLARALRETFALGHWDLAHFEAFLAEHEAYFPPGFSQPSFLDNHDLNRFLYLCGGERARLALGALVLFTLSGPPIVYYGTETGVTQERPIHQAGSAVFEAARMPMNWDLAQAAGLLETFRRLSDLRRRHAVLLSGARRAVHLDAGAGTYAYLRCADPARYTAWDVLVAVNLSGETRTLRLALDGFGGTSDLLNGQPVRRTAEGLEIELAPLSGAWIG